MIAAGQASGVPWSLLAAVASVESDFGRNMATSSAGAVGYGQFLPETWAAYGAGDPYDFHDAIPAMARYLAAAGAATDVARAVYAYNHSWSYVAIVLARAAAYATLGPAGTPVGIRGGGVVIGTRRRAPASCALAALAALASGWSAWRAARPGSTPPPTTLRPRPRATSWSRPAPSTRQTPTTTSTALAAASPAESCSRAIADARLDAGAARRAAVHSNGHRSVLARLAPCRRRDGGRRRDAAPPLARVRRMARAGHPTAVAAGARAPARALARDRLRAHRPGSPGLVAGQ